MFFIIGRLQMTCFTVGDYLGEHKLREKDKKKTIKASVFLNFSKIN